MPGLVKRLIKNSNSSVDGLRIPQGDDISIPGFDGIVHAEKGTLYVEEGTSVWEFGTSSDAQRKIKDDCLKRTVNSLGVKKSEVTLCLVTTQILANKKTSITELENKYKKDWKKVRIYDAVVLVEWINSEPAVCAWFFEQYTVGGVGGFATVSRAWNEFSNRTSPKMSFSLLTNGREDEMDIFYEAIQQKVCRIQSTSRLDAFGFCLAALMQDEKKRDVVIVVNDENTYHKLIQIVTGKIFLLAFSYWGQVSDQNNTIVCYSKADPYCAEMIKLSDVRKTLFVSALQDMGFSAESSEEEYYYTHGSLLAFMRRNIGNVANTRPMWTNAPTKDSLFSIVFLRKYNVESELEKRVLSAIAEEKYEILERKFEELVGIEDSPLKRVGDNYLVVNYEEALLTLRIDASSNWLKRICDEIVNLLTEERNQGGTTSEYSSVVRRLCFNYAYISKFADTDYGKEKLKKYVAEIVKHIFATTRGAWIGIPALSILADVAPIIVMQALEVNQESVKQLFDKKNDGFGSYSNILLALETLIEHEETAGRACAFLRMLCDVDREYYYSYTPRQCLINTLWLWNQNTALETSEKSEICRSFMEEMPAFGVPFAIDLIGTTSIIRSIRIGKEKNDVIPVKGSDLRKALCDIASTIVDFAISNQNAEWMEKLLNIYWFVPCEVFSASAQKLTEISIPDEQRIKLMYKLKHQLFYMVKHDREQRRLWEKPLNEWVEKLTLGYPIAEYGWMFYRYYHTPFQELLSEDDLYLVNENRIGEIRAEWLQKIRGDLGSDFVIKLVRFMEDLQSWGCFVAKYMNRDEVKRCSRIAVQQHKLRLLAGIISETNIEVATTLYEELSGKEKSEILPNLQRNDIDEWLNTEEKASLFWRNRIMREYNEREYVNLLKYNPNGILWALTQAKDDEVFQKIPEVLKEFSGWDDFAESDMVIIAVRKYDQKHYSTDWADLCDELFNEHISLWRQDYYPECLKRYYFENPEKLIERIGSWTVSNYIFPKEAFEEREALSFWCDYLYNRSSDEGETYGLLGDIIGRAIYSCGDGIPNEHFRFVLEKIPRSEIIKKVARGYLNAQFVRSITDGIKEKRIAKRYQDYAESIKNEYPHTALFLHSLARYYNMEADRDWIYSELSSVL